MSNFFSAHGLSQKDQSPLYDLYGVVNHYGGILGGHYTSFVRCVNKNGNRNDVGKFISCMVRQWIVRNRRPTGLM